MCDRFSITDVVSPPEITITADLARQIWTEYYPPIIGAEQTAYMIDKFQSAAAICRHISEGFHYSAAFADGVPAGYCATRYEPGERRVFLSKIYVARPFRGMGIARALLEHHLAALSGKPAASVWLTVNKYNADAIAAYRRMGFAVRDSVVTDIGAGYVMDDFIMEKTLE